LGGHSPRTYPRFAIDAAIRIESTTGSAQGRSRNLSRGGLCLEVDQPFEVGSDVSIHVTLRFDDEGESEPLALPARVVWCTPIGTRFQLGTQFCALPTRESSFLEMFLRYLEANEPAAEDPVEEDPFT
jgi:hypothetical protein